MSRAIAFKDIKNGDRIRFSHEMLVSGVSEDGQSLYTDSGAYTRGYLEGMQSLELVSRPIVLPELGGSVVRLAASGTGVTATWLLHHSGEWVSASGVRKIGPDFLRFVEQSGLTLEVIA